MPSWFVSAMLGLLFGTTVSLFNHFLVKQVLGKDENTVDLKLKNKVLMRYGIRYLLNFLAMFLVYKNTPMLIATALGLTVNKNVLFIKYLSNLNHGKKGVN